MVLMDHYDAIERIYSGNSFNINFKTVTFCPLYTILKIRVYKTAVLPVT